MPFYKISKEKDRVEIYFEDIPSRERRNELKANRWWWDAEDKCWWNRNDQASLRFAAALCPEASDFAIPPSESQMELIEKGQCGPTAIYLLSCFGQLLIGGIGEITGYDYDQIEKSPWHHMRHRIRSIKIQNGITSIGKRAFYAFDELTEVDLPDSLEIIEDHVFSKCTKLSTVRMSPNIRKIGSRAFKDCTSLRELQIPASLKELGEDCFKGWKSNQNLYRYKKDKRTGQYIKTAYTPNEGDASTEICLDDFVTVTTNNYCVNKGHYYENIQAKVKLLCKDCSIKEVTIPAGYCRTCKKYTIGLWQFEKLKKMGIVLCRVVHEEYGKSGGSGDFYSDLSAESLLKQYGYSVNASDGLADEQRKYILTCLMESGICSKQKITGHLSWLIQSREGRMEQQLAVCKWRADRDFVDAYKMGTGRTVVMRVLRVRGGQVYG